MDKPDRGGPVGRRAVFVVLGQRWLVIAGLVAASDTVARQPSTHAGGEIPAIMGIEAACV
jgi:hypothetical protein